MTLSQISAGELAAMQATTELTFPDTATIQRRTLASNGQGGRTETWATLDTVACRLSPIESATTDETTVGNRPLTEELRIITFQADTDINETDRIVISGVTFEVTSIAAPRTTEISRRVEAKEID